MSKRRAAQSRQERTRRRRDDRRRRRRDPCSTTLPGTEEWATTVVLTRGGGRPDPERLRAFAELGAMSDALLRLMEPYVWWPPAPFEVEALEEWLQFGAAIWNATLLETSAELLRHRLRSLVLQGDLADEEDPISLAEEIALRKLRLFGDDYRLIASVRVRVEGGRATVEAASVASLR